MKGKTGKLLCIYACAAIAVLGLYAGLSRSRLSDFRLAARYSSSRAFEETVGAVGNLSLALRKSLYATDSGMCCRICSDVYADARAAETAMATLPFSTVEMARISGFLGVAGDYAYSLCPEAAANGFSDEQRSALYDMSAAAEEFAMALSEMQGSITDGTITMDTREVRIENVGEAAQQTKLSEQLSEYEESFAAPAALKYDGRYGARDGEETAQKTPEELKKTAADFLGVGEASLDLKYEYSGEDSRRCYSCRGVEVCVDSRGVVSMGSDRIIGDAVLDAAEAEKAAGEFLEQHGYDGLELTARSQNGGAAVFTYAQLMGDALCLNRTLTVSVALDDGSIYAFRADGYELEPAEIVWPEGEIYTSVQQPEGLTLGEVRPVVIESAGGRDLACWEMSYTDEDGRGVVIYVDAESGLQRDIVIK